MWALFGEFAKQHDYKIFNDYECDGYYPIKVLSISSVISSSTAVMNICLLPLLSQDIVVGPHGDFKSHWRNGMPRHGPEVGKRVKPGSKRVNVDKSPMQMMESTHLDSSSVRKGMWICFSIAYF
jgi:hypothetical protein